MQSSAAPPPTAHHRSLDSKYKCQFLLRVEPTLFGNGCTSAPPQDDGTFKAGMEYFFFILFKRSTS